MALRSLIVLVSILGLLGGSTLPAVYAQARGEVQGERRERLALADSTRNGRRQAAQHAAAANAGNTYAEQQNRLHQQMTLEEAAAWAAAAEAADREQEAIEREILQPREAERARQREVYRLRQERIAEERERQRDERDMGDREGDSRRAYAARRAHEARKVRRQASNEAASPDGDNPSPNTRRRDRWRSRYRNASDEARVDLIQRIVRVRELQWEQMSAEEQPGRAEGCKCTAHGCLS